MHKKTKKKVKNHWSLFKRNLINKAKGMTFLIHYLFLISLLFYVKLTYSADIRVEKINNIIVQTNILSISWSYPLVHIYCILLYIWPKRSRPQTYFLLSFFSSLFDCCKTVKYQREFNSSLVLLVVCCLLLYYTFNEWMRLFFFFFFIRFF